MKSIISDDITKDPKLTKKMIWSTISKMEKEDFKDIFKPSFLEKQSLNEYINGDEKVQTVSKQLAPMFEYRILEAFSRILEDARGSGFDFIYKETGKKVELKTSQVRQGKSCSFTGNKISTKNCDHLLINYTLDYDKIIEEDNTGIIKELYIGYIKDVDANWWTSGTSKFSNFSKLNVPKDHINNVTSIIGNAKVGRKYIVFHSSEREDY
jgi:hypothetical protein